MREFQCPHCLAKYENVGLLASHMENDDQIDPAWVTQYVSIFPEESPDVTPKRKHSVSSATETSQPPPAVTRFRVWFVVNGPDYHRREIPGDETFTGFCWQLQSLYYNNLGEELDIDRFEFILVKKRFHGHEAWEPFMDSESYYRMVQRLLGVASRWRHAIVRPRSSPAMMLPLRIHPAQHQAIRMANDALVPPTLAINPAQHQAIRAAEGAPAPPLLAIGPASAAMQPLPSSLESEPNGMRKRRRLLPNGPIPVILAPRNIPYIPVNHRFRYESPCMGAQHGKEKVLTDDTTILAPSQQSAHLSRSTIASSAARMTHQNQTPESAGKATRRLLPASPLSQTAATTFIPYTPPTTTAPSTSSMALTLARARESVIREHGRIVTPADTESPAQHERQVVDLTELDVDTDATVSEC